MLHKDTKKFLIKIGIPESILKKINKSVYLRNKALEWSEKNLPFKDYLKIRDKIEKFMLKYDIVAAKASVIYPETVITLNKLKKDNIKMCIITNTSKKATYHIINKFKLNNFFSTIVTREDVKKLKPEPDMILKIISKIHAEEYWVIGDSKVDVQSAKKCKINSILIKRDGTKPKYSANYVIQNLEEILQII